MDPYYQRPSFGYSFLQGAAPFLPSLAARLTDNAMKPDDKEAQRAGLTSQYGQPPNVGGDVLKGAVGGAAAGTAFGPVGTAVGAGVGALTSGLSALLAPKPISPAPSWTIANRQPFIPLQNQMIMP